MASSDEDIPLMQRNQAFFFNKTNPVLAASDDDDSPLPSWLGNPKPAGKGNTTLIDSDSDSDDVKEVISPVKLISPSKNQQQPTTAIQDKPVPDAPFTTKRQSLGKLILTKKPTPKKKTPTPAKNNDGAGPSHPPAAAAATGTIGNLAAAGRTAGGLPVASSCIPVVIPDRIPQIKILLELESTDELHGATDLSGDSGAIGRVLVNNISTNGAGGSGNGTQQQQQLQIDLKGRKIAKKKNRFLK